MALSPFVVTIVTKTDAPFNVLPNAPLEIRERLASGASGALSSIFSDSAGLNPITQTGFTTDSLGQATFFAASADLKVFAPFFCLFQVIPTTLVTFFLFVG